MVSFLLIACTFDHLLLKHSNHKLLPKFVMVVSCGTFITLLLTRYFSYGASDYAEYWIFAAPFYLFIYFISF